MSKSKSTFSQSKVSDDEWEEEETYVVVELTGTLDTEFLKTSEGNCSILGIDTDKPLLQMDTYLFTGEYEHPLGTNLLFEKKIPSDLHGDNHGESHLEYFCNVDKKLNMIRAFVKPKVEEDVDESSSKNAEKPDKGDEATQPIPSTSSDSDTMT